MESTRAEHPDAALFILGRHGVRFEAIEDAAAVTGLPVLRADQQLDGKIRRAAQFGYRNGHVPVAGALSAIAVLVAMLHGRDAVVMFNEWSASVGNTTAHVRVVISWALAQGSTRQWLRPLCDLRGVVVSWPLAQGSTRDRCGIREWWRTANDLAPGGTTAAHRSRSAHQPPCVDDGRERLVARLTVRWHPVRPQQRSRSHRPTAGRDSRSAYTLPRGTIQSCAWPETSTMRRTSPPTGSSRW